MYSPQHIVFSGGGTGGHLFPGLVVADELRRTDAALRITFAGCGREFEQRHVEAAGYGYLSITCRPWPRRAWRLPGFALEHFRAVRTSEKFLREQGADLVVGLGGFASVPTARAAVTLGVPLVLLEQNVVAGRANRWLAPFAARVCTAFHETWDSLPATACAVTTGNPVRVAHRKPRSANSEKLLLILGGSGGARELNEHVPSALAQCRASLAGWSVVHQCGASAVETTRAAYDHVGVPAEIQPFVIDLLSLVSRADLAVCRGGGTTLAELAAAEVPAIVCPWAGAADDHQLRNAEVFLSLGACRLIDTRETASALDARLAEALGELMSNESARRDMALAMRRLANPTAALLVAEVIRETISPNARLRAA